jgi:hypothetical protein
MRHTASGKRKSASRSISKYKPKRPLDRKQRFVICLSNKDYPVSLTKGKVYEIIPDEQAESDTLVRVVDDSGEDYLYSKSYFASIALPRPVARALAKGS